MAVPSYVGQIGSFYDVASISSFTITTTSNVVAGDTVFISFRHGGTAYPSSITDSLGNSYVALHPLTGTTVRGSLFGLVAKNAIPSGTVITVTMTAAGTSYNAFVFVFRNVTLSGSSVVDFGNGVTTLTSTALTPLQTNGILISTGNINAGNKPVTSTTGFTTLPLTATGTWHSVAWKQMSSSTIAPTSITWTNGVAVNFGSVTASLNATSGEFFTLF